MTAARRALVPWPVLTALGPGTLLVFVVRSQIAIPLGEAAERLWPLACLAALPAGVALATAGDRWLELVSGRARQVRLGLVLTVVGVVTVAVLIGAAVVVATSGGATHAAEVARNFVFVLGLTLVAHRSPARELPWAPGLGVVMVCWLLGSSPPGQDPARWALTLQPIGDRPAAAIATLFAVIGFGSYVTFRSSRSACSP